MAVTLDEEMAKRGEAIVARRGVVDREALDVGHELAAERSLAPVLRADPAVAAHGTAAYSAAPAERR